MTTPLVLCSEELQRKLLAIPDRYVNAAPEKIKNAALRALVMKYLTTEWNEIGAKKRFGLLLSGPNGSGKTWAMCAMLSAMVGGKRVRSGRFVQASDFFRLANPLAHLDEGTSAFVDDRTYAQYFKETPALVISDLGKEDRRGKFAQSAPMILGDVLRARSQAKLLTYVDTNLSMSDQGENTIMAVYGTSVHDLFLETMVAVRVSTKGPSLRKEQNDKIKARLQ